MESGLSDLVTALGLVFVLEGLLLALAPGLLRRLVTEMLTYPVQSLRLAGLFAVALGVVIVWLARG